MKKDIQKLYQEVILQHNDHPYNFFKTDEADYVIEAYNQFCGDQFNLYLNVEGNVITKVSFHGYGCAISKASTSLLTAYLEGKDFEQARKAYQSFRALIYPEETSSDLLLLPEVFKAFEAARAFPSRKKCAILSWEELSGFLEVNH